MFVLHDSSHLFQVRKLISKMFYLVQWKDKSLSVVEEANILKMNGNSVNVMWYGKSLPAKIIAFNGQ